MGHLDLERIDRLGRKFRVKPSGDEKVYADAVELSAKLSPEEPLFCFSAETLRARIAQFLDGFPGEVAYAVKANPGAHILLTAAAAGLKVFDVASVHEMADVRAAVPEARFHYHNPIKSRREIEDAFLDHGCRRFAADDLREVEKIAEVTARALGVEIAVRFRLPRFGGSSAHDFSSKFGATRDEAVTLVRAIVARGLVPVLTFHPGSQCTEPSAYARHIGAAAKIARRAGAKLAALNVGGGFPACYRNCLIPPLEDFFATIATAAAREFGPGVPALECEPGRGIVAPSTSLLTRVKLVKSKRGEVFINDGIYGALMEVYQAPGLVPPVRAIRDGKVQKGATRPFIIYGPTCDPLDKLPVKFDLPADIREGDFVEFGSVGAYAAATSTRFNGYGRNEVRQVRQVFGA